MSSSPLSNTIIEAQLSWQDDKHPHSKVFDDHYYSLINGLAESQHVFFEGNHLDERFSKLHDDETFYIVETGFGSGLNFLSTAQAWKNSQKRGKTKLKAKLHFISIEAYPMSKQQLNKSLDNWQQEFPELREQLLMQYPKLSAGQHGLYFDENNISLSLLFGDVVQQLSLLIDKDCAAQAQKVDAWFLDGFAPSKNPEMWQDSMYSQMFKLSSTGSTVATYTVAGMVRRGLAKAGFKVVKSPGFGTKREMLRAFVE